MANYFQIFSPLVFSYRLFIFTNRGNFQARTRVWRKFAAENRVKEGNWAGVKWSSQSRKTNFLTLPDLAFGFVHKRSGNEINRNPYKARHRRICAIWTSWSVAYTSFSTESWTFKEWHEENLYSKSQITVLCRSNQTERWQLTRFSRIPISAGIWLKFHIQRAVSLGDASFIARQISFENWCQCCTRCVSWRSC